MKIHYSIFTAVKRLFILCGLVHICALSAYATEPTNDGAYTTFSTVYGGKRYYLGVDTVKAKADTPIDTVTWYEGPNYATMWQMGKVQQSGTIYQRTIKNVWLAERITAPARTRKFLALGTDKGTYTPLVLKDTAQATLWRAEAAIGAATHKYVEGYVYYFSDATGVDMYRYITYDPLYKFSRTYSARPSAPFRVSVWDRKKGSDITCTLTPSAHTFGLNLTEDTVKLPITSRVYYYEYVDRFRSRYDQFDVFAANSEPFYDQDELANQDGPYAMFGFYEWSSNPRTPLPTSVETLGSYDGKGKMSYYGVTAIDTTGHEDDPSQWVITYGKVDTTVLWVSDTKYDLHKAEELWYDTIFAIGTSMFDVHEAVETSPGVYTKGALKEHSDWLRQHFYIKNSSGVYQHYVDSIRIDVRTFTKSPRTSVIMNSSPASAVFEYTYGDKLVNGTAISATDTARTFDVSAEFESVTDVMYINNSIASTIYNEDGTLSIDKMSAFPDDPVSPTVWYDSLLVEVLMPDGTNAIIGGDRAGSGAWIESVRLTAKDQIYVKVAQFNDGNKDQTANRVAQLRYTYHYYHSDIEGDIATTTRVIWLTQKSKTASDASLYTFQRKTGVGEDDAVSDPQKPQQVHTKKYTFYAIPGDALQLPIHRDHWGYYRWYKWRGTSVDNEVDIENTSAWSFVKNPTNELKGDFWPINPPTDGSSRGQWDIMKYSNHIATPHFTFGKQTNVPSVRYPASISQRDTFACDVSAYMDITPTGTVGVSLTGLVEPTLSYRNLFYIEPAKTQADKMANCRVNGGTKNWMEEHNVIVPAGRTFTLHQQYPVLNGEDDVVEESHLQYIYYFNPDALGNADPNMGVKHNDSTDTKATCYGRIGKPSYTQTLSATRLSSEDLTAMKVGDTKTILVVNPGKTTGYVLGSKEVGGDQVDFGSFDGVVNNEITLNNLMSSYYVNQPAYVMVLTKIADASEGNIGKYTIYCKRTAGPKPQYLTNYWAFSYAYTVRFPQPISSVYLTWSRDITISAPFSIDEGTPNVISSADTYVTDANYLFAMYMDQGTHRGYVGAYDYKSNAYYHPDKEVEVYSSIPGPSLVNAAWCFYEIGNRTAHQETPYWQKSTVAEPADDNDAHWTTVATEGTNTSSYEMLADGSLKIKGIVHGTAGDSAYYRLRTEHFQLAKFKAWFRNPATEGPYETAIIGEEDMLNNFDILYTNKTEDFTPPGTEDFTEYFHHLPWTFTELSYHYPQAQIGSTNRVDTTSTLPMKGEYSYINKFVDPTNPSNVIESMAGAKYGYMMCIHTPEKPVNFFQFEYQDVPCPDQELYLTANLCNPVDNAYRPEITADMEGYRNGVWYPIYRYKSGEIPYNAEHHWYQLVLPLSQKYIQGFTKFRCIATTQSSMEPNSFLLVDRVRFIARVRPVTVFQNKTTCLTGGKVDIVARLDYQNSSFPANTLVAFQYQKLNKSTHEFEAMDTDVKNPNHVTYINDAGTDATTYGIVKIPAKNFTPTGASADSIRPIGGVTSLPKCYVNEAASGAPYWVIFLSQQVAPTALGTDSFRVAMAVLPNASATPEFASAQCATERIIGIKKPVELRLDDKPWVNVTRAVAADTLKAANNTYRLKTILTDATIPDGATSGSGKCKFDILKVTETQDYVALVQAWQADMSDETKRKAMQDADAAFKAKFGLSHTDLLEAMEIFRNVECPVAEETNWNNVKPADFTFSGRTIEEADSIYRLLDNLITKKRVMEIGLEYKDVFMGSDQDAYFYVHPVTASGRYIMSGKEDTIEVCNTPIWFEIHSGSSNYTLRLGRDNIVNGNYQVPVIRATRTQAKAEGANRLPVRIAEIASSEATDTVILGWEKTELIESNDPEWLADKSLTFKYQQDIDMREHVPSATAYYTKGSVIQFKAADGNTLPLKAGYWYSFKTAFYGVSETTTYSEPDRDPDGYAEFILAVAPDTVRWTPSHAESANYWNDDDNWTAIVGGADFHGCIATVPMGDTKVIIPAPEKENLLPLLSEDSALVARRVDTLDYGYKFNTCDKILFKPDAVMLGQELLDYNQAFVDVKFISGRPMTFTPTLDHVYAGDMYVPWDKVTYNKDLPATGASVDTVDFDPQPFPAGDDFDDKSYNPRMYPYAFFQSFYNTSLPVAYMNTDTEGHDLAHDTIKKNVIAWAYTNMLDKHYKPGSVCMIDCYDAYDDADREIIVRLPKKDHEYYYFYKSGDTYSSSWHVDLKIGEEERTYANLFQNLAYDKSKLVGTGDDIGVDYTLTNLISSDLFFFGNPTMSLIDVYTLCVDNADKLKYEDGKYYFTTYVVGASSSYIAGSITGPGQYYIAPQRAVGLVAKEACKELTIRLKPHAMVAMTGDKSVVDRMPRRRMPKAGEPEGRYLYISAANETDNGECKSFITLGEQADALRGYRYGEDALSLTSGQYEFNYNSFNTPLGLYTIADNQPLMRDVRDSLGIVPIVFTKIEDKYSYADKTRLSFALDGEWDTPLYLFDALTGDSTLILNGLQIEVETPQNDQIRYYIHGRRVAQTTTTPGTATGLDPVTPENGTSSDNTTGLTSIYDVLGRKIMTLQEHDLISNIQLPTGVYIIQRGTKSERMVIR